MNTVKSRYSTGSIDTSKNTVLHAEGESKYYIDRTTYYLIKGNLRNTETLLRGSGGGRTLRGTLSKT